MNIKLKKWYNENKQNIVYVSIILVVFTVLYFQTFSFGYCRFDDTDIFIKNADSFTSNFSFSKIFLSDAFTDQTSVFYRPIQNLTFAVDIFISGNPENALPLHVSNVIYFALFLLSLFFFFLKFGIKNKLAFWGCLFFAVNPLFVSSIAWIPARGDIFLALFSVTSMIFFIDFLKTKSVKNMVLVCVFYTLALFSKETAVALPVIYLTYFLAFQEEKKLSVKHFILAFVLLVIGMFWYWLRSKALVGYDVRPFSQKLSDFLYHFISIPTGISQFFFPIKYSPLPVFSKIKTILGLLLIVVMAFSVKNTNTPFRKNIFYAIWYIILCLPVFMGARLIGIDYLDHRFILPLVGFMLLFFSILPEKWIAKLRWIGFAVLLVYASISFTRTGYYKNGDTFYAKIFETSKSPIAYNNRGAYKQGNGDFQGALEDYSKAIELNPKYEDAYSNRAIMQFHFGNLVAAYQDINKAIALYQGRPQFYNNRAGIRHALKDYEGSLQDVSKAIKINSNYAEAYKNRAMIYNQMGKYQLALIDVEKAIKLKKEYASAIDLKKQIEKSLINN